MVVLPLIVLGALLASNRVPDVVQPAQAGGALPPLTVPGDLSGFSADAWFLPDDALLGFVEIPGGPFIMGSDPAVDPGFFDNERWEHTAAQGVLELPTYYIGRYEVTVAQFRAFVEATGHRADEQALRAAPDHPVVAVSWPDALAYTRWLDRTLRESPRTPAQLRALLEAGWRVTLPTEAQWEKAARGTDGRVFPWGNAPRGDRANFEGRGTMRVGSFECPECPYGLADMSGNVWEWTRSPYSSDAHSYREHQPSLTEDALWTMRGGSFSDPARFSRAAIRGGADPGVRRPFIGFRVVISPPDQTR